MGSYQAALKYQQPHLQNARTHFVIYFVRINYNVYAGVCLQVQIEVLQRGHHIAMGFLYSCPELKHTASVGICRSMLVTAHTVAACCSGHPLLTIVRHEMWECV